MQLNPDLYFSVLVTMAKFIALLSGFFAVTGLTIYVAGVTWLWRQETQRLARSRKMKLVVAPSDRHLPKPA